MKLITLNIWGGRLKKPLLGFFENYSDRADIFCLQEVFEAGTIRRPTGQQDERSTFNEIEDRLPAHAGYFHPSQSNGEGLAIFVRRDMQIKDVEDLFVYRWKDAMEGDDPRTLGRNMQYISFADAGKQYLIGNVHGLWNGINKLDSEDRLRQSQIINSFFNDRAEDYKLLMGDFNLFPETESIKMIEATMRNLIKDYRIQSTRTRLYHHHETFADYVFVTPNLKVNSFEVLADEVSDHAPLLLDID